MVYKGQLTILRGFIPPLRQQPKKQTTLRFETPPGNQYSVCCDYVGQIVKVSETLNHPIKIYGEHECITKHPINTKNETTHIRIEH